MQTIYALIILVAGGEPDLDRTFLTEAGCERAVARAVAEMANATAWCASAEFSLAQEEGQ